MKQHFAPLVELDIDFSSEAFWTLCHFASWSVSVAIGAVCGGKAKLRRVGLLGVSVLLFTGLANAGTISVCSGFDSNVGAGLPASRPKSTAAALCFDAFGQTESIIDFESPSSYPLGPFTTLSFSVGSLGVTIGTNQEIRNSLLGVPDTLYGFNTTLGGSKWLSLFGGSITFTFSKPITDFGAYLSGVQLTGETITFNDGSPQTVSLPNPGSSGGIEFVGFKDDMPFSSVSINVQGDIVGVDDVRGSAAPEVTPEPASFPLVCAGLVLAGILRRRKRRFVGAGPPA